MASHSAWWRNNLNVFIYAIELDGVYVGNIVYHYDRSMAAAYFQIYLAILVPRGQRDRQGGNERFDGCDL